MATIAYAKVGSFDVEPHHFHERLLGCNIMLDDVHWFGSMDRSLGQNEKGQHFKLLKE